MKVRPYHLIFSLFLAGALLFSQAGLTFFHDKHIGRQHTDWPHKYQTQLNKHGEHCKICSINLFFSLFVESPDQLTELTGKAATQDVVQDKVETIATSFSRGRAPPVFFP